jgi:hypothetical protein
LEFFKLAPLALYFLLVLVDLAILLVGGIFTSLELIADETTSARA